MSDAASSVSDPTILAIGAVTGANRGLGYAIIRRIALQFDKGPLRLYLLVRDEQRGKDAIQALHHDPELQAAKVLTKDGGPVTLACKKLDMNHGNEIQNVYQYFCATYPAGIDFFINNAAIALKPASNFTPATVHATFRINYWNTLFATQLFAAHLRPQRGRLINVASRSGKLAAYSPDIAARFRRAAAAGSVADVGAVLLAYAGAVSRGHAAAATAAAAAAAAASEIGADGVPTSDVDAITDKHSETTETEAAGTAADIAAAAAAAAAATLAAEGWGDATPYAVSKAGVTAVTMVVAREDRETGGGRLINSCCPGGVKTVLSGFEGDKTPDEGAVTPVLLAIGDIGDQTGLFWENEHPSTW